MRRWYRRLLLGGAIDAVCIGRVEESCRYVLALRRVLRFRLTVYLHGAELRVLQRRWRRFRRALRWAIREADTVVAVSEELRGEAVGFAPAAAGKVRVIPNGVDVAAIRGQAPASWPRPYLLFAGRLERVKNAAFLIEAFAQAAAQVDPLDLVLAGSGSEERALTELVAARGLNGRVRLHGSVVRADEGRPVPGRAVARRGASSRRARGLGRRYPRARERCQGPATPRARWG
jgi:glycosyltransferase involved in cell wall biosynthesis